MLAAKIRPPILWATVAAIWLGLIVVVTLNGGLRAGVGLFSVFNALHLADAEAATIDVDAGGFQAPIFGAIGIFVIGIASALRVVPSRASLVIASLTTLVIGAYVDARFGADMITRLMTARGYERCSLADHFVHSFKATTFFHNYVAGTGHCGAIPKARRG